MSPDLRCGLNLNADEFGYARFESNEMYSTLLLIVVGVSVLVALQNWRLGLLLCVLVGALQDPIRKVTPDTPIYLTLAFVPIYVAMFVNLWMTHPVLSDFFRHYQRAAVITFFVLLALAISSVQTLSYGLHAWQAVVLGLSFYIGWIPALFLGFFFLRRDYAELDRPLLLFGVITSVMLVGTLLEYVGVKFSAPWLGMVAYTGEWRRWYNETEWVAMMSGFYRSPEIMAWHAATLVIVSVYMLVRRPAWAALWVPQAVWGVCCVLLSGRRKMIIMILIFAGVFALLAEGRRRIGVLFYVLLVGVALAFVTSYFINERYIDTAESSFAVANKRVSGQTITGPLWLIADEYGKSRWFGYGVGTRAQGAQHLQIEFDVPQFEGGLEKVLVELGIGTVVMIAFAVFLVRISVLSFRRAWASRMDSTPMAALAGFLIANMLTYLVAFQVYGDPFIGFLLGFGVGLLLSAPRLVAQQRWLQPARAAAVDLSRAPRPHMTSAT